MKTICLAVSVLKDNVGYPVFKLEFESFIPILYRISHANSFLFRRLNLEKNDVFLTQEVISARLNHYHMNLDYIIHMVMALGSTNLVQASFSLRMKYRQFQPQKALRRYWCQKSWHSQVLWQLP